MPISKSKLIKQCIRQLLGKDPEQQMLLEWEKIYGPFDLIISQAILEHLITPYAHMLDLCNLLQTDGYILVHTVTPGFVYHRYPIDVYRFFPDFFEKIARDQKVIIHRRRIHDNHIFYMLPKKATPSTN
jgi:cyclopropane fatty-acyl-phospholipid synthase-like methyltransferase